MAGTTFGPILEWYNRSKHWLYRSTGTTSLWGGTTSLCKTGKIKTATTFAYELRIRRNLVCWKAKDKRKHNLDRNIKKQQLIKYHNKMVRTLSQIRLLKTPTPSTQK